MKLPKDIILLVCSYMPKYVMVKWLNKLFRNDFLDDKNQLMFDNINLWSLLARNPNSIDFIEEYLPYSITKSLYGHPGVAPLLDRIPLPNKAWKILSGNHGAIEVLEQNINKINWRKLSANKGAIDLLEKNIDKINWDKLSCNKESARLWTNLDKMNWEHCSKSGPIEIIKNNLNKINWIHLSCYDDAIDILKNNKDKVTVHIINNKHAIELMPLDESFVKIYQDVRTIPCVKDLENAIICRGTKDTELVVNIWKNTFDELAKLGTNIAKFKMLIGITTENMHMLHLIESVYNSDNRNTKIDLASLCYNPGIFVPIRNTKYIDMLMKIL